MNASYRSVMRTVSVGVWAAPLFMAMAIAHQAHGEGWQKTFGGAGAVQKSYSLQQVSDDGYIIVAVSTLFRVQQTTDGGYIIAGSAQSAGDSDVYLVKTDPVGNTQWEKTFGGEGNDYGYSVQQTADGGYIIAGVTGEGVADSDADVYLIKTDAAGNIQWEQSFGGIGDDGGTSVQQTADGGYIVAGNTYSFGAGNIDAYLIKTDGAGNAQWQKTFGGEGNDFGYSVQQTSDGGYIVAGLTESSGSGGSDVYLVKTDGAGNPQWAKAIGGEYGDSANAVQQTTDGGYIITGLTSGTGEAESDIYLIKTDGAGNPQWAKAIGGTANETGLSVQQTTDGGYIVAGNTYSFGAGNSDVYLVKTDTGGNVQWGKTFGGIGDDVGYTVQQTTDGGYIIVGNTLSFHSHGDVYLIKTDASGNAEWEKTP